MFAGRNMFWTRTRTHFSPSHKARVKMTSEKGPKHISAGEHKLDIYYYHFERH